MTDELEYALENFVREDGVAGKFVGKEWVWSVIDELKKQGFETSPEEVRKVLKERFDVDVIWEWEGK
jgi:hypothetical protein